jgi:hypothetical protein
MPGHFSMGCGAFHRWSPVGGVGNARNMTSFRVVPKWAPSSLPESMGRNRCESVGDCDCDRAKLTEQKTTKMRLGFVIPFTAYLVAYRVLYRKRLSEYA